MRQEGNDVNTEQWNRIKALKPTAPQFVHVSCRAAMIEIPGPDGKVVGHQPWIQRPGVTFEPGRNKAKRERRELHAKWGRG